MAKAEGAEGGKGSVGIFIPGALLKGRLRGGVAVPTCGELREGRICPARVSGQGLERGGCCKGMAAAPPLPPPPPSTPLIKILN